MTAQRETLQLQPDVLRWARERADLTPDELAHKVHLITDRVLEWENSGRISMTWAERLADATHTPLGYLFLSLPPYESLPIRDFRTRNGESPAKPSLDLLETIHAMQRRQDWLHEESVTTGAEPLHFIAAYHPNRGYTAVADAMRNALLLASDWAATVPTWSNALSYLRDVIESAGIMVVFNGVVGQQYQQKTGSRRIPRFCPGR